jgi:hypothetical protein
LDFSWFLTGIFRLAPAGDKETTVNVYTYEDSETNPNEIILKPDEPVRFIFREDETAEIMGKLQVVKKYEYLGAGGFSMLQVTSEGLAAKGSMKSDAANGFAMTNYKKYEVWGPTP